MVWKHLLKQRPLQSSQSKQRLLPQLQPVDPRHSKRSWAATEALQSSSGLKLETQPDLQKRPPRWQPTMAWSRLFTIWTDMTQANSTPTLAPSSSPRHGAKARCQTTQRRFGTRSAAESLPLPMFTSVSAPLVIPPTMNSARQAPIGMTSTLNSAQTEFTTLNSVTSTSTHHGHNGFLKPFRSSHASMRLEPSKKFFSTR